MPVSGSQSRGSLSCAYGIEGINSISANLLLNGVAFYMTQRFGWSATENLLLAMGQGAFTVEINPDQTPATSAVDAALGLPVEVVLRRIEEEVGRG